ncbi:MAG: 4-alpha-glucanotransferase [Rhodospirillaceae bacterium]|nr:4-alpha-glucanotransferase [Rhodospirillaceae bacterium]
MTQTPLGRLAEAAGIVPQYHDIRGVEHPTKEETARIFLGRMGLPADTEAEVAASLALLAAREWGRLLQPVAVLASETPERWVAVQVPNDAAELVLSWDLVRENGRRDAGQVRPSELDVLETGGPLARPVTRYRLPLPADLADGYHVLTATLGAAAEAASCRVAVAPPRCWMPQDVVGEERVAGISCQLYSLNGGRHGLGIGHFGDLARLCRRTGEAGFDVVGINPLHALFPSDPAQASPYSPASRHFLNMLYIDPEAVPEFALSREAQAYYGAATASMDLSGGMIDYVAVASRLFPVLHACHAAFRSHHVAAGTDRAAAFDAFRAFRAPRLDDFATFLALQDVFAAERTDGLDWRTWPEEFRDPRSAAVARFRVEHADTVSFYCYLQWLADGQLAAAAGNGRHAGLRIGLYTDMAIGVGPTSFTAWHEPDLMVAGASVGAPPDPLGPQGQDWGLSPFNPLALRDHGYEPIISAIRQNMQHAGAIRIDHVMGMARLFWVPAGGLPADGAYVRYPLDDLLRLVALESCRAQCIVIGEDLGTVPDGLRERLQAAGVLGCRVLMFERWDDGLFKEPSFYSDLALVTSGTHDTATLAGFWTGRDLQWREELHQYKTGAIRDAAQADRQADRRRLIDALINHRDWPREPWTDTEEQTLDQHLLAAIYGYLAATPCRLMMVAIEDILCQVEQMNLPGTVHEHPNWCRRLAAGVDEIFDRPATRKLLADLLERRKAAGGRAPST